MTENCKHEWLSSYNEPGQAYTFISITVPSKTVNFDICLLCGKITPVPEAKLAKRYRITYEECDELGWAPDLGMVMVASDIEDARRQFEAYSPGHFGRRNVSIELESDYFARQAPDHDDDECLQR